jgi:hypothetical protein
VTLFTEALTKPMWLLRRGDAVDVPEFEYSMFIAAEYVFERRQFHRETASGK